MKETDHRRRIELLAPARDAAHGRVAIDYGADAVYVGAPCFGARRAVSNSLSEIESLIRYARKFHAKVYITLNTLLFDNELEAARKIAREVWNQGADALIVQDMAFLEMDLPPIPLHASTQTFNLSPRKVRFLEEAGFSRVILERGISLPEIHAVRSVTGVELEVFVHGAICVCYSGQCYMSRAISSNSGNRGDCLQPCRWDYDLADGSGKPLLKNAHLLSVRDLNLAGQLSALLEAGVGSLKIEGRLKDIYYIKNVVAHYRQLLDGIIENSDKFARASSGRVRFDFSPDPEKSFSRGYTDFFLTGRKKGTGSDDTPKSKGSLTGTIKTVGNDYFETERPVEFSNGDGITFRTPLGWKGTHVNRTENGRIYPNRMDGLAPGTDLYRNRDQAFRKVLDHSRTVRRIPTVFHLNAAPDRLHLTVTDEEKHSFSLSVDGTYAPAVDREKAEEAAKRQLSKTGDTPFTAERVVIDWATPLYLPASTLNDIRRRTLAGLEALRHASYRREERSSRKDRPVYPDPRVDFTLNVTNELARAFYRKHGILHPPDGFELAPDGIGKAVMRTRYCVRRETGNCGISSGKNADSLYMENTAHRFRLEFNCTACEMNVIYLGPKRKKRTNP